jgi:type VI protein secretion system component Hcp
MDLPKCPGGPNRGWARLLGLLVALASSQAHAGQWYLKLDDVPGELTEGVLAGWSPLQSAGTLVRLPVDPDNGNAGLPSFSFEFVKVFDRTSPSLIQSLGSNEPYRRVSLAYVLMQPAAAQYRITFDNVFVTSVKQEALYDPLEAVSREKVTFRFDRMEMACFELAPDGGTVGGLTGVFDQTTGEGGLKTRPPFTAIISRQDGRFGVMVTWPAEVGHRYHVLGGTATGKPWTKLLEFTATEDGPTTQFIAMEEPVLLMRVVEVD